MAMQIPTPEEFHKATAANLAPEVDRAVESILAAMAKETPAHRYCIDTHKVMIPHELREFVRRRFAASGWSLSFSGSYQGEWIEIQTKDKA